MAMKTCLCKILASFSKKNGRHSQLFKNHKGALNLEIFQLASSNLHKSYMARKTSLIVILALVQKTKWQPYHMFKVRHVFA